MNIDSVEDWLTRFPKLENFIDAGTISLKSARSILGLTRAEMYCVFMDLLEAGAVSMRSSNSWYATKELREYLKERRSNYEERPR